jgi:hypothetical protein
MKHASALLMLALLFACGGGSRVSPTAPSPTPAPASGWPAGAVIELVDGETGAMVQGQVNVAGAPVPAGVPLASPAPAGVAVDVTVSGFLPRQTSVRTGETRLGLWPDKPDFPGDYTKSLVYTDTIDGSIAPLRHLPSRVRGVAVSPTADLQANADVMDALRQAVDGINGALAGCGVTYALGGSADFTVPVRLDPSDSSCSAGTRRATSWIWLGAAGEIQRAEVVACSEPFARNVGTMAHELGHTFGLQHSMDDRDLMYGTYGPSRSTVPTPRETLAMALLVQRRPGTAWPDDDRNVQAAARRFEIIE